MRMQTSEEILLARNERLILARDAIGRMNSKLNKDLIAKVYEVQALIDLNELEREKSISQINEHITRATAMQADLNDLNNRDEKRREQLHVADLQCDNLEAEIADLKNELTKRPQRPKSVR